MRPTGNLDITDPIEGYYAPSGVADFELVEARCLEDWRFRRKDVEFRLFGCEALVFEHFKADAFEHVIGKRVVLVYQTEEGHALVDAQSDEDGTSDFVGNSPDEKPC